jgi:hypothetical protein
MTNELFDKLTSGAFYDRFLNFMDAAGLEQVRVEYSGGGDSGGPDGIEFSPYKNKKLCEDIRSSFEEELSEPIYQRHGSFADGGGYSVNGEVIWDSTNKTVHMEGTDHHYSYEDCDEENEDCEPEETDSDWEETIFTKDENTRNSGDKDYSLVCLYAKHFMNGKLPEEHHNRILAAAAVEGDESAKEYINNLKSK